MSRRENLRGSVRAAIGVATFTVRATKDIIQRNAQLILKCSKMTKHHGDQYIPTNDFDPYRMLFRLIGGLWRPDDNAWKGRVAWVFYGGTGEGDFKIPISRNHGEIHRIGFNKTAHSERLKYPEKEPIFFYDVWANFAFGYFLRQCGYSSEGAALFARELGGPFGDDSADQKAVKKGAALESFEEKLIIDTVRSDSDFFYNKKDKLTPLCV